MGFAKFLKADSDENDFCGSPQYMAPEILNQSNASYNEKVDIWATGITLYKLLNGECEEYTAF